MTRNFVAHLVGGNSMGNCDTRSYGVGFPEFRKNFPPQFNGEYNPSTNENKISCATFMLKKKKIKELVEELKREWFGWDSSNLKEF